MHNLVFCTKNDQQKIASPKHNLIPCKDYSNKDFFMSAHPTTGQPKLLDLVRERIRYKHMSYRTEQAYCGWIKRYVIFHKMRHPRDMGRTEVESYLSHLVNIGSVSQSTHQQRAGPANSDSLPSGKAAWFRHDKPMKSGAKDEQTSPPESQSGI